MPGKAFAEDTGLDPTRLRIGWVSFCVQGGPNQTKAKARLSLYSNMEIVVDVFIFTIGAEQPGSSVYITGSGRCGKVRKTWSNIFFLIACRNPGVMKSYDQKTKQVQESSIHEC